MRTRKASWLPLPSSFHLATFTVHHYSITYCKQLLGRFPELSYMARRPCKISLTYVHPFSISEIHTVLYQAWTDCVWLGYVWLGYVRLQTRMRTALLSRVLSRLQVVDSSDHLVSINDYRKLKTIIFHFSYGITHTQNFNKLVDIIHFHNRTKEVSNVMRMRKASWLPPPSSFHHATFTVHHCSITHCKQLLAMFPELSYMAQSPCKI
jgi:hypothetical protein